MPGKINRQRTILSVLHSSHVASQRKTTQRGSWLEKLPAWGILALTPTDPRGYARLQQNISVLLIWDNPKNSVAEISFYRWKAGADLGVGVFTHCGSSGQNADIATAFLNWEVLMGRWLNARSLSLQLPWKYCRRGFDLGKREQGQYKVLACSHRTHSLPYHLPLPCLSF